MRRSAATITTVLAVLTTAGCGGGDEQATASANLSSAASSSAPTSATPSSSSPAPTPTSSPTPGPGTEIPTDFGTVTYFGQQRPAAPDAPAPQASGTEWVAIDVQLCLNPGVGGGTVRSSSWVVRDAGNGLTDPSSLTYDQFPAPQYPTEVPLDAGCVRGWVTYPIVAGKALTSVQYVSESQPDPVTWTA